MIIDNPDRIRLKYLMLYFRLKLEVKNPTGPTWRIPPAGICREILVENGQPDPGRMKKAIYNAFGAWLMDKGYISKHEEIA